MSVHDLHDDADKSCEQLELLTTVLQEFSTTLDIDATLQHVTSLVKQYLDAEGVSLFLLENDERELVCRVCASLPDITGVILAADEGIVGRTLRENKTQMVRDVSKDPDFYDGVDVRSGIVTRSVLCAPLILNDERIGALEAINKNTESSLFDEHDRNLLTILANISAMAIHNSRMAQELVFQERTRRELELARDIQAALLPGHSEDYQVYGCNIPARMVSGDFYDHFQLEDGRVCFSLGDVSGKGINASLLMAKTTSIFRCLGKRIQSPSKLLTVLNNELYANATRGMFVTMVAGIFDPRQQTLVMVNAGHQPPLLRTRDANVIAQVIASPPLGVLPDVSYEEYQLRLDGGDLYIFTDGLTECWVQRNKQLGEDGVIAMIDRFSDVSATDRLQQIMQAVTQWKRENTGYLFDDITMMLISGDALDDEKKSGDINYQD